MGGLLVPPGRTVGFRATSAANCRFHDGVGMQIPDGHGRPRFCLGEIRPARAGVMALSVSALRSPLGTASLEKAHPSVGPARHEPMSDLLLTHGYFLFEDEKEIQIMRPYPTLGLLYISAFLRRDGFDVEVFDSTFAQRQELFDRLARGRGVIGIYTNLMTRRPVLDIVAAAKRHGWTVVLGGPESATSPAEYLASGADVVVVGEGETTMAELLPALAARGPHNLHGVAGTVFRDANGVVVRNAEREKISDLDSLPWPDRGQIDQARYVDVWREPHGMGSVNLITARGCPYKCNWCSHAVFGYTHRRRSYLDCTSELEHIMETYRPDQVWYSDDVFTISHPWLFGYAKELKRRKLRVPFETISRADRMMKDEVLETLADMGC